MANNRPRILIIDDTPDNIHVLAKALSLEYQVQVATDGPRALQIAQRPEQQPDLILLDIMMPNMSGLEVCRRLKEQEATQHIPVVFVTALDGMTDETSGLELGAVDYISKPFHLPIVLARIRNHINLKLKTDLLERYANLDGLTNIANRRRFDEAIDKEWRRASRYGQVLSLALIDVDCFKQYNDTYGHGEGDVCLYRIARALDMVLTRPGDLLARYGGEEFAAILPSTEPEGAKTIAMRLREAVMALDIPHAGNEAAQVVTISVGCASVRPNKDVPFRQLLDTADSLLYVAKAAGRNCVRADLVEL